MSHPGWLIGLLILAYEIIPTKLGPVFHPQQTPNQPGAFFSLLKSSDQLGAPGLFAVYLTSNPLPPRMQSSQMSRFRFWIPEPKNGSYIILVVTIASWVGG